MMLNVVQVETRRALNLESLYQRLLLQLKARAVVHGERLNHYGKELATASLFL